MKEWSIEAYESAVDYVREHKTWTDAQEHRAMMKMWNNGISIYKASRSIAEKIGSLMDKYGSDNDLRPDWWTQYGDADDIFMAL